VDVVVSAVGLALPGVERPEDLLATRRTDVPADPVDPAARLGRRGLRYKDRATRLALCAAGDALRDGGFLAAGDGALSVPATAVGVVASSNLGNLDTVCEVASSITAETTRGISPMALPNASSNVISSSVAIKYGLRGPNITLCNGQASGLDAVFWAARMVAAGRCASSLVVGVEPRNDVTTRLTGGKDDLLDGAVALMVEREDSARARGAAVLARLGGYAREKSVADCLARVLAGASPAPGIWFVPERHTGAGPEGLDRSVPRHDLTDGFGRASGALGVLQCAAATAWLATASGFALVTCGDDTTDGVAGLVLAGGERGPG
jgi:3-oxoacyl-[acyl-carrier-protein] synthase II